MVRNDRRWHGTGRYSAPVYTKASINASPSQIGRVQIAINTVTDPRGGCLNGIAGEVGVARRRLDLGVTEQLSNHRQPLTERQGARSKGMPES